MRRSDPRSHRGLAAPVGLALGLLAVGAAPVPAAAATRAAAVTTAGDASPDAKTTASDGAAAAAAESPYGFDLLPPPPPSATATAAALPAAATDLAVTRRKMLQAHQVLGLTTLGTMAATVVLGQLNYNDIYTPNGGHTGNFQLPHMLGAYTTTAAFVATASLSLFAPTPYARPLTGIDTAVVHRSLVALASAGFVTQVVLGFVTARSADAGNGHHLGTYARVHQVVGYSTLGVLAAAATVWIF